MRMSSFGFGLGLACLIAGAAGDAASAAQTPGCLPASVRNTLAQVRAKFGPIEVISAHRPGARIAGSGHASLHASCRAVDFNPPPGKYTAVANWLKANHAGGVGTYSCGMHHIHIDNGAHVRFHKCEGGTQVARARMKGSKVAAAGSAKKRTKYAAQ